MMWLLRNPFSKSSPHPLPFPRKREENPEPLLNLPLGKGETKRGSIPTRARNVILLAILFALSFFWAGPLSAHDGRPAALQSVDLEQKLGAQVPLDAEFRDEAGRTVRLKDYFGRRPVILSLVYYSCEDLCPIGA